MPNNNPLDDDLLKELGLDEEEAPKAPKTSPKAPQPSPPPQVARTEAVKAPVKMPAPEAPRFEDKFKNLSQNLPVEVIAVLSKKSTTLRDLLSLREGSIVSFPKASHETVDLVANGRLLARGEMVLVEGKIGIRIKEIIPQ